MSILIGSVFIHLTLTTPSTNNIFPAAVLFQKVSNPDSIWHIYSMWATSGSDAALLALWWPGQNGYEIKSLITISTPLNNNNNKESATSRVICKSITDYCYQENNAERATFSKT